MSYVTRTEWEDHFARGEGFRRLGEGERALLAEHVPAPDGGGRALDVGAGTGELAAHLAAVGYLVDAVDYADSAHARARDEHPGNGQVRRLVLDIENGDPSGLDPAGYDLITLRLVYPFLTCRTSVLHALGERLRPGGALVVITPTAKGVPKDRRDIALDEDEITVLTGGWEKSERLDADGLAMLVLRGPCPPDTRAAEKGTPAGHALIEAALAVVTDRAGRVLLGRSAHALWELPGGKSRGSEELAAAAVRELAEETGLFAEPAGAVVVAMLVDDAAGVPRLTAVVRVTAWSGTLTNREPDLFARWEWHTLHTLARIGPVFTPAAHALDSVWPGIIPGLPPVHAYPLAAVQPPVPGEPVEAVRLRHAMADAVADGGWAPSEPVRRALRTVPRHRYVPEQDLRTAYDDGHAPVTRRNATGRATSSVSAPWLQADMIESLRLRPGAVVFEAGSGGYNAELLAAVTGPAGRVVTGDIDPYVVQRSRRFTAEAGSGRVTLFQGDAADGAPASLVPRGGFDGGMVTYNVRDIAPAWREQLADGGRLVVPLEIHGYTRAIAFQRRGDVLHAVKFTHCGFVRAQGAHASRATVVDLLGGALRLRFEDGPADGTGGLEAALRDRRHEMPTGVTMGSGFYFGSLHLYTATTVTGFCRLAVDRDRDTGAVRPAPGDTAPAVTDRGSLAYLTYEQIRDGDTPAEKLWEWVVHAFGDRGPQLAEHLAGAVRAWDRDVRGRAEDPGLTVHPAGTPDHELPAGDVLDKPRCRLVFQWPGRHATHPAPAQTQAAPVDRATDRHSPSSPGGALMSQELPPANASALIHNGRGEYLMRLRDDIPGIREPGAWSLLGGGREPGDRTLEDTVRRELREKAGLELGRLEPLAVEYTTGTDGVTVPFQTFTGRWEKHPDTLSPTDGVTLRWFTPDAMNRLRMSPTTLDLVRRHAALPATPSPEHPAPGPAGLEPELAVREIWTAYGAHHLRRGTLVEDVDDIRWGYGAGGPGAEVLGDVSGLRVLDLGSGTGRHAARLARLGARVDAVEASPTQHERAIARYRETPGLRLIHADAVTHLSGTAKPYDLVYAVHALSYIDPYRLLPALAMALRRGGRLVFSVLHTNSAGTMPSDTVQARPQTLPLAGGGELMVPMWALTPDRWQALLAEHGLVTDAVVVLSAPDEDDPVSCTLVQARRPAPDAEPAAPGART
ncbi:methyltransferase, FxLD system [Streptomyces sp. NPDC048290]|uniref:methyltransferase, FxLD system n=1 Tax=Streptomyces sp. NPDC048290 TaxID=3155811 RepID=UPI00343FCAB5